MKLPLLKALVMLEKWENSWFLNGGFHESIDGQLIDVKALRVNMQDFDGTLRMVVKQAPDVLLLESTMSPQFVSRMAIQVRNKLPNLPILLLPDIHGAVEQLESPPEVGAIASRRRGRQQPDRGRHDCANPALCSWPSWVTTHIAADGVEGRSDRLA
jgi:hypothetical protein